MVVCSRESGSLRTFKYPEILAQTGVSDGGGLLIGKDFVRSEPHIWCIIAQTGTTGHIQHRGENGLTAVPLKFTKSEVRLVQMRHSTEARVGSKRVLSGLSGQ